MGVLLHALRNSGLLEQSILIFTSDHGEALYEHKLVEHSDVIYNEVLRIPLLIRVPGIQPRVIDQYVGLKDVMPTILDILEIAAPETQGVSLLPAILEGQTLGLMPLSELEMCDRPRALQGTLGGRDYKIIQWLDTGRTSFFDLTADPEEKHDLWKQGGQEQAQFRTRLAKQLKENVAWASQYQDDSSPAEGIAEADWEIEQRLKDLGYIE
jgi:arylsulfatase A-like enzyme